MYRKVTTLISFASAAESNDNFFLFFHGAYLYIVKLFACMSSGENLA